MRKQCGNSRALSSALPRPRLEKSIKERSPNIMPAPERTQKHLADVELICAEIKRFSSMSWEELKAHFAKFPQDGIHSIPRPDRRGSLVLGRAGGPAFSR